LEQIELTEEVSSSVEETSTEEPVVPSTSDFERSETHDERQEEEESSRGG
jgi:hypothetical protein